MSDKLLEAWAQDLKDTYGQQICARLKHLIKKNTVALSQTIRNKDISFGEFSEDVNRRMAVISYLRRTLRSMLSDDLTEYKDYLRACIREGYTLKRVGNNCLDETSALFDFLQRYDDTRAIRLRKLKGILLQKIRKYSS